MVCDGDYARCRRGTGTSPTAWPANRSNPAQSQLSRDSARETIRRVDHTRYVRVKTIFFLRTISIYGVEIARRDGEAWAPMRSRSRDGGKDASRHFLSDSLPIPYDLFMESLAYL